MHQRFDVGQLTNVEKTPQGGLRVAAHLTRTGVFKYVTDAGNEIAEYRPPEEVFDSSSLESISDAPLTVGHVAMVSPDNHSALSAGHVRDVKQDGDKVAGTVVVQGRKAIKAIEGGMREVSLGYTCRTDNTPGITADGIRYDRVQRDIRINHLALVPKGRAGADVRLRLDSDDNQVSQTEVTMSEKNTGADIERADGAALANKLHDANEALKTELTKQTARADAAEADKAKLAIELATLKDPARLDAAVSARALLIENARKALGAEAKFDGQSDVQIKAAVVGKVYPGLRLDESDPARTSVLYEAAIVGLESIEKATRADSAANGALRLAINNATPSVDLMDQVRQDEQEWSRNAWKRPLGVPNKEGA